MSPLFIVVLYGQTNAKSCKPVLESADENVYFCEKERNIRFEGIFFFKIGITFRNTSCLLLGYKCKPVLESADVNVYLSEKERNIRFKKKTVFKIALP
jgi:hypothetical protein